MTGQRTIDDFSADEIAAAIPRALDRGLMPIVAGLLRRLAILDPDRADRMARSIVDDAATDVVVLE